MRQRLDKERKRFEHANETEAEHLARLDAEKNRSRIDRANETEAKHLARLEADKLRKRNNRAYEKDANFPIQQIRQQRNLQEEPEDNNRVREEAVAERHPALTIHDADYNNQLEAEEIPLAMAERQEANIIQEEEIRARVEAEAEQQANVFQEVENQARLEAEKLRQANLRQQEMADILAAMNRRPEAVRPRVLIQETEAEKLARLERKSSRQQTLHNKESEAEKWQRQKKDALAS